MPLPYFQSILVFPFNSDRLQPQGSREIAKRKKTHVRFIFKQNIPAFKEYYAQNAKPIDIEGNRQEQH